MSVGQPVNAQQWGQLWLPLWPLASDDLRRGIYRTSRAKARTCRYIEANPAALSNLLVIDIDHEDALMRAVWDRHDWLPNAVVESPSGRAHAVWALKEPFTRTEYARRCWAARAQLRGAMATWIERTYHRRCRQARLGRLTPPSSKSS